MFLKDYNRKYPTQKLLKLMLKSRYSGILISRLYPRPKGRGFTLVLLNNGQNKTRFGGLVDPIKICSES